MSLVEIEAGGPGGDIGPPRRATGQSVKIASIDAADCGGNIGDR